MGKKYVKKLEVNVISFSNDWDINSQFTGLVSKFFVKRCM